MTAPTLPAVSRTVTVRTPRAHAFGFFADQPTGWWPAAHSIGGLPFVEIVVERQAGGRWYERSADGGSYEWGRVLAYEPPHRLLLAWHLNAAWQFDTAPEHASEIEVTFAEAGADATLVTLEHRGFERHGPGSETIAEAVAGPGGWDQVLACFGAAAVSAGATPR